MPLRGDAFPPRPPRLGDAMMRNWRTGDLLRRPLVLGDWIKISADLCLIAIYYLQYKKINGYFLKNNLSIIERTACP
jgi:hypothetical protein